MGFWDLIIREILFRKSGFILSLVSVTAAIAVMTGTISLSAAHTRNADKQIAYRQDSSEQEMFQMRDDYRRFMKDMGHNSLILHSDQNISAFLNTGQPNIDFPEEYAYRLAESSRASYNHLLPVLMKRTLWPEQDIEIVLTGTPGQLPVQAKPRFWTEEGYTDPIRSDIPAGKIEIGHSLAHDLGIESGEEVILMGDAFVVHRVIPPQGNWEDISIWCSLEKVQEWSNKTGKINAIFALECMGDAPVLGGIGRHVTSVLPDTQVLQFASLIDTRLQARGTASEISSATAQAEQDHYYKISNEYSDFAVLLIIVVLSGSGVWLFGLSLDNVRRRRPEIGILRAYGTKRSTVYKIFMLKAVITGLIGAVLGYMLGTAAGAFVAEVGLFSLEFIRFNSLFLLIAALITASLLCAIACWLPARWAAKQDPASMLEEI